jgi:hypothetical protein
LSKSAIVARGVSLDQIPEPGKDFKGPINRQFRAISVFRRNPPRAWRDCQAEDASERLIGAEMVADD